MEYVSRVPQPPMDQLVDDLYYLEGTPPYSRLKLPPGSYSVTLSREGTSPVTEKIKVPEAKAVADREFPEEDRDVEVTFRTHELADYRLEPVNRPKDDWEDF